MDYLLIYKASRLILLFLAIVYVVYYFYSPKRRDKIEEAKFRMLQED
jgi:cbb3-type cytochrome oxidase subunit 3